MSDEWSKAWPANTGSRENSIIQKTLIINEDSLLPTIIYGVGIRAGKTNKIPTHDPYVNKLGQIYYSCKCGQILDPGTKSFAALNNHASVMGWKIRLGEVCYQAYCVECANGIE